MLRRAAFLDRDGVLNHAMIVGGKPYAPLTLADSVIDPDVAPLLASLKAAGFVLVCVTNQPDVARGRVTRAAVDAINAEMRRRLPLDDLRVCFHDTPDNCDCRKPKPGMLLDSAKDLGIDLTRSVMVGDRWSDVEAGHRAGCQSVLVGDGYGETPIGKPPEAIVKSLADAVVWILER